jgi:serine protease
VGFSPPFVRHEKPVTMKSLLHTVLSLALAISAAAALAQERNPARGMRPISEPADAARVIVKLKADAPLAREQPLSVHASASQAQAVLDARAVRLSTRLGLSLAAGRALDERTQVLKASGVSSAALAQRLAREADVEYAVVDHRRRALLVPNDPLYLSGGTAGPAVGQWYLREPTATVVSSIDAPGAWDLTTGSDGLVVAVLDTGVRFEHPDLAGKLLAGYDMIHDAAVANDGSGRDSDASDPGDWVSQADIDSGTLSGIGCTAADIGNSSWHGTLTSSLIGAATNNGIGMAGVAWGVKLLPVRVLGKCGGYDSDIIVGMQWAAGIAVPGVPANTTPARVLNMSLGGDGACDASYTSAMSVITAKGVVVVASAGNSEGLAVGSPANCPGVIAVAGLRHIGTKVGFSSLGPEVTISAPGGNCVNTTGPCLYPILAASNTGTTVPVASTYTNSTNVSVGTSFSAPLVSGTVALMLSQQPTLTPAQVIAALKSSARPFPTSGADSTVTQCQPPSATKQDECYCTTSTCGAGMLDAAAAVAVVSAVLPHIDVSPASPVVGDTLTLSAAGTVLASGRSIASVQWTLGDAGSTGAAFVGATNTTTATLQTSAAGSLTVRVTVTDDQGASGSANTTISVSAASTAAAHGGGGGGGGGAASPLVLLGLGAVLLGLARRRR